MTYDDEDELDDDEGPADADVDSDDSADDADTRPCPRCRRPIYEDAQACPHCGSYVSAEGSAAKPLWIALGVALCIVIVLLAWLR